MVIKYEFLSALEGEVLEVEVDEALGKAIAEMDDAEQKNNRSETRRHVYMSRLDPDGRYLPTNCDLLEDILESELHGELIRAIDKLQPQQKELLIRVFCKRELQKDIAAEEGVSERAISGRMKRIMNSLKKFLKNF